MGKVSFHILLYVFTTCGRKTYSVWIKLPIQIYFALKKRHEGETFTSVFFSFFFFFFLPPCSICYAWYIFSRATQLIIGFLVPVASPKAAILFFHVPMSLTMSPIKETLYRKCSTANIQAIKQPNINVLESSEEMLMNIPWSLRDLAARCEKHNYSWPQPWALSVHSPTCGKATTCFPTSPGSHCGWQ